MQPGTHSAAASSSNEEHKYVPLVSVPVDQSEQPLRSQHENAPLLPPKSAPVVVATTIKRKRISVVSVNALDKGFSILRTQVKTLFEQIEMHVDNFYVNTAVGLPLLTPEQQEQIQKFDTPYLEDSMAGVLPEASDPRPVIKHCLANTVVSGIDFTSNKTRGYALLPSDMMSMYQTISSMASEQQVRQWRNDTMSLLGTDAIVGAVNISTVVRHFTQAFSPWASETYSLEARMSHLTKVIREAVELGSEIFGQPGEFRWRWQSDGEVDVRSTAPQVVVFPGLSMTTGANEGETFSGHHEHGKKRIEVVAPSMTAL